MHRNLSAKIHSSLQFGMQGKICESPFLSWQQISVKSLAVLLTPSSSLLIPIHTAVWKLYFSLHTEQQNLVFTDSYSADESHEVSIWHNAIPFFSFFFFFWSVGCINDPVFPINLWIIDVAKLISHKWGYTTAIMLMMLAVQWRILS